MALWDQEVVPTTAVMVCSALSLVSPSTYSSRVLMEELRMKRSTASFTSCVHDSSVTSGSATQLMKIFGPDRRPADWLCNGATFYRVNQEEKKGSLPAGGPQEEQEQEEEEKPCLSQLLSPPSSVDEEEGDFQ